MSTEQADRVMNRVIGDININAELRPIAEGLYRILEERKEDGIVAFGMMPKWVADTLAKEIRLKLMRDTEAKSANLDKAVDIITKEIVIEIFAVARDHKKMLV